MDSMNRRKFFQRLGLTAAVAAIAPGLLAKETAEVPFGVEFDGGPKLVMDFGGSNHIEFRYFEAWGKPVWVTPDITVMFLPRQLGWASDGIIIRAKGYGSRYIEVMERKDVYVYMVQDKLHIKPRSFTFPDELGTIRVNNE